MMRAIGFLTEGQYLFLTDHSGVGNSHAMPQAPSYSVEKLDQLMVRMIAEKLCGEAGLPQDVIAVEEPVQAAGVRPAAGWMSAPASQLQVVAETSTVPTHFDWWAIAQAIAIVGGALLLTVVERLQGV
jgi:hypothetical protein